MVKVILCCSKSYNLKKQLEKLVSSFVICLFEHYSHIVYFSSETLTFNKLRCGSGFVRLGITFRSNLEDEFKAPFPVFKRRAQFKTELSFFGYRSSSSAHASASVVSVTILKTLTHSHVPVLKFILMSGPYFSSRSFTIKEF